MGTARGPDPPEAAKTTVVRERSFKPVRDWRPLVVRTSGSATHGVYGLILATAVITVSRELDSSDAGRAALSVLVAALVFWLTHVYARLLGRAVSDDGSWSQGAVVGAINHGASRAGALASATIALALGISMVLLKVLIH